MLEPKIYEPTETNTFSDPVVEWPGCPAGAGLNLADAGNTLADVPVAPRGSLADQLRAESCRERVGRPAHYLHSKP